MCRRPPTESRRLVQLVHAGASGSAPANLLSINSKFRIGALVHRFSTPPITQNRARWSLGQIPITQNVVYGMPEIHAQAHQYGIFQCKTTD